ncbi:MAG: tRNA (N6-isopentenyl adenosine(37)-C2)-methylthiotransferase MiaB [Candidatus Latescibacteria bacterium]|jgi:tRNA-2-methylthio-N6-dimethylallyladenosine synthase|nr:tRNA (N6-isopentenyl adenosine(37)-C2)-methylthiotransferase MiaB [Candidatus Latescibacterota bacterium]
MNKADSELIIGLLTQDGFHRTDDEEQADVILVNTCAIRENAEQRVLGRMSELNRHKHVNPELVLGLCGCVSQHLGEKILDKAPYIDLVVGPDAYRDLPETLRSLDQKHEPALNLSWDRVEHYLDINPVREPGVNGWVTIMRGCDKMCAFCIVPYVRGRERSTPHKEIIRQVQRLAHEGYREVTLLGQTVNKYEDGDVDFASLVKQVAEVSGIERVRFTSPHPSHFPDHLIATMADHPEICAHTHLPLQSGSSTTLERMRRDYTAEEFLSVVKRLRDRIPNIALTTDVITGFCGETDEEFQATYDMMSEVKFDAAFMFKYSPRSGTAAYKRLEDNVPEHVKGERLTAIIDLQKDISMLNNEAYIGRTVNVLVEGQSKKDPEKLYGKTDTFKTTVFPDHPGISAHTIVSVDVTHVSPFTLFGEVR